MSLHKNMDRLVKIEKITPKSEREWWAIALKVSHWRDYGENMMKETCEKFNKNGCCTGFEYHPCCDRTK